MCLLFQVDKGNDGVGALDQLAMDVGAIIAREALKLLFSCRCQPRLMPPLKERANEQVLVEQAKIQK